MAVNFPSISYIVLALFFVIAVGFFLTELSFLAGVASIDDDHQYKHSNGCIIYQSNGTEFTKCREDFGFLGWKEWTTDHEEELIEGSLLRIINPAPQKIIIVPEGSNFNYNLGEP